MHVLKFDMISDACPKISGVREVYSNPWLTVCEKDVAFTSDPTKTEAYYSLKVVDYVAVFARLPDGKIPLVRQYRPAIEAMSWELPSGLRDSAETEEEICRKELKEETGLDTVEVVKLGTLTSDVGRIGNRLHAFYAKTSEMPAEFKCAEPIETALVTDEELMQMMRKGEFVFSIHMGVIALAKLWENRIS